KPPEAEQTKLSADAPKPDDFGTHEEFIRATARWEVRQELKADSEKKQQETLKTEQQTKLNTFLSKREAFAKSHDDFFERMSDIEKIPMSLTVNEALLESENGPELLYELAKDPDEYKRICSLPAIAAAREIGRFEAKLEPSERTEPGKTLTTKAPKPISPVGGKTGSG